MPEWKEVGNNVRYNVEGTKLTIECDLEQNFGPSGSKKTIIIASSGGNKTVEGYKKVRKFGLNLFKYPNSD